MRVTDQYEHVAPGALDGIRVVDLTTVLMGPYASRMLGDHGADVIRVEPPDADRATGDLGGLREMGLTLQRNKRGMILDLKSDEGLAAMLDVVATADVFVSNIREAALDRLGLAADQLRARNPRLIHCVANGYGRGGPYEDWAAYDDAIQASSGLAALTGRRDEQPSYVPSAIVDKICSLFIVQAVMAALLHRHRSGEGQTIRVPMFETMVGFNLVEHFRTAALDPPLVPIGYPRVLARDRRPYRCADGWIALLPYTDANYRAFFELVGRPDLIDDERFATHRSRVANVDALYALIAGFAPERTTAEWLEVCGEASIPASPMLDLDDLVDDPQVAATGLIERTEHPTLGPYRSVGLATSYDTMSTGLRRHAPVPGEHTAEVLAELGWDAGRIDALTSGRTAADG